MVKMCVRAQGREIWWAVVNTVTNPRVSYRGADKSLARPGRKQTQKHVRDACDFNNIETRAVIFPLCKARRRRKFTPF